MRGPAFAVLSVLAAIASPPGSRAETACIARAGAELRAAAGFAGAVAARLPAGERVVVEERRSEWARVRAGERSGWLHEVFVAPCPGAADEPPARAAAPPDVVVPPSAATSAPRAASAPGPAGRGAADPAHAREVSALRAELADALLAVGAARAEAQTQARALDERLGRLTAENESLRRERDAALAAGAGAEDCGARIEAAVAAALAGPDVEARLAAARAEGAEAERAACEARVAAALAEGRAASQSAHEAALAATRSEHAAAMAELERGHDLLVEKYVEEVTRRHEAALAREMAARDAACEQRLVEERRQADKALRVARKESGWEQELEREVRARVKERLDLELGEAEARCAAKHRGEQYEAERAWREETERMKLACKADELAAVDAALSALRAEMERKLAATRQEADLRCQVALELVLEQAAAGADQAKVRALAERARGGDGEGRGADGTGAPPEASPPVAVPVPVPVPVPADRR